MGFPGVILHGLCSYGHAARAVLLSVAGGDSSRLEYMSSRFTSPVIPGDEVSLSPSSPLGFLPIADSAPRRHC